MGLLFSKYLVPFYDWFMFEHKLYMTKEIETFLNGLSELIILDVAGGTGVNAQRLSELGHRVVVVDVSMPMLKTLLKRERGSMPVCGNAEKLPFECNRFDLILVTDAFHHFTDKERALKEMRRVLKVGGILIMQEMRPDTLKTKLIRILEKMFMERADYLMPDRLCKMVKKFDFDGHIIETDKYQYFFFGRKGG